MLKDRIAAFVANTESGDFEGLALEAFAWQFERVEPYRILCQKRGVAPATLAHWEQIPTVPAAAFRSLTLAAEPAIETFRSSGTQSGTTGSEEGSGGATGRSVHHHAYPDLYRRTIDVSFPRYCLEAAAQPPMLALIGDREQLPDSSLAFMVDHVLTHLGDPSSRHAFGPRGVDFPAARSWLAARQRDGRPALILTTAFALAQLLERLDKLGLRFRLPAGSTVFETGGFKGRARELSRDELTAAVTATMSVPAGRIVREYGMTELTSQFYTEALRGGDPNRFVAPHWTRVRILDPETLAAAPAGTPGLIAVFDLANLNSAVHLLTEDLGVAEGGGFRLLGRAAGAQLRGCSLTVEELSG